MMKNLFIFFLTIITFSSFSQNIESITFKLEKISNFEETFKKINKSHYNIAFSSILPANAVYKIVANNNMSGIVQIGSLDLQTDPVNIYIKDEFYDFLKNKDTASNSDEVKLIFLGWNYTDKNKNEFVDIKQLIVTPSTSLNEVINNGKDKYYIQLGSYSYYQNSFPRITEMLPFLEFKPRFYMMKQNIKKDGKKIDVYRVLAGPYHKDIAENISQIINKEQNNNILLRSAESIIEENE